MSSRQQPWDFYEAVEAARRSAEYQKAAESQLESDTQACAEAERAYRKALAVKIVELRSEWPATVCADLARGDAHVADLRYARDVAEGVKEATKQRAWRHAADRKDTHELIQWGRMVAPLGEQREMAA